MHMGGQSTVFRVAVANVPTYLQPEEFRAQFLSSEGVTNATAGKDENGCASALKRGGAVTASLPCHSVPGVLTGIPFVQVRQLLYRL